ncbi:MAG: glycosyltransferase family 4 protein [Bryobacteraceae bacterium]|jgi:glycosyltransferase involved in cell wall biosynthesis
MRIADGAGVEDPIALQEPRLPRTHAALAVIETHPIQYHAPVYSHLQSRFGIPVSAIYASDFSVAGYRDREFGASFRWDTDLMSGYTASFLSTVADGGPSSAEEASTSGLPKALRAASPAAILLTGYSPRFHRNAWVAAWRARVPLLLRAETTDHARGRGRMRDAARTQALRLLYRSCSRFLYVGRRSRAHFERLGIPQDRLVFSPYCVDTSAFRCDEEARLHLRAATRERLGILESDLVILFSGKLSPRKAPNLLFGAVESLARETGRRMTLAFLGSGELETGLRQMASASPAGAHFLGFRNQSELSPYYHAADLLVLPSLHSETWGLVVNEALHHGVPCVVSDAVGCGPDLIEPGVTGEIATAGFQASLAAAIARALPLVDRRDIRERCREKAAGYTVEKAAAGIAEAFQAVRRPQ